jgi:hypothetical protein
MKSRRCDRPGSLAHALESSAERATNATELCVIPRLMQYFDCNHSTRRFFPLLALHPIQHLAMFSGVTICASLMMCSHDGLSRRFEFGPSNETAQYTQRRSRSMISRSSQSGMFQRFISNGSSLLGNNLPATYLHAIEKAALENQGG